MRESRAGPDLEARVRGLEARVAALESGGGGMRVYGIFLQKKNALGTVLSEVRLNNQNYGDLYSCEYNRTNEAACR